ncbi:MAG: 50S ribosomal protein L32 [bacterium]|nr:50S ribosomal protein L32 [bacterium]
MTPLPKRKTSHGRQGRRRAHLGLKVPTTAKCGKCGAQKLPHRACPVCGTYRSPKKSVTHTK